MSVNDFFLKYKNTEVFHDKKSVKECFDYFDRDRDGFLNKQEFDVLLKTLYSFNGNSYFISADNLQKIFDHYDTNKRNLIDMNNFETFWQTAVKSALFSRKALIVVDVQNDFITGTLAIKNCPAKHDGAEVVPVINELVTQIPFDLIVYTKDWHPADHISFYNNLKLYKMTEKNPESVNLFDTVEFELNNNRKIKQTLWPVHCVQDTHGADFDPNLIVPNDKNRVVIIEKASHPEVESHSGFLCNERIHKTNLDDELKSRNITDVYVCGLTTDYCVGATAKDALEFEYNVVFIENATRGVALETIESTRKNLIDKGAIFVNSKQVYKMVSGDDRRPELLYSTL